MRQKDIESYRTTEYPELLKKIRELEKNYDTLSIDRYMKKLKNTRERKNIRKTVAVIRTVLKEKEL